MHPLDNPILSSLASRHARFAQRAGDVLRYPAAIAPFLGVPTGARVDADALAALVPADDIVYLLGDAPVEPAGWSLKAYGELAQMTCDAPVAEPDGPPIERLADTQRADVLAITALVYPHYFRSHTMDLGRYFGIHRDGRLAAMIGERMATEDWQEISAVCTHPDFAGRGLARRLLAVLTNEILAQGRTPFLHVSHDNARAKRLYEALGYRVRRDIGFFSLRRA